MSQQNDARPALAPLKTRRPPDAAHRRRRAGHRPGQLHRATSCCRACCSPACCAARIRTRASGRSTCRRRRRCPASRRILTHENCQRRLGRRLDCRRPAVQRRGQEDHEAAPLRLQQPGAVRRRAGGGGRGRRPARRRRGARADRRRLRGAAVRARHEGGAQARARRRSGRKATSRRTTATRRSRSARGAATSPQALTHVRPRVRGSLHAPRSCTTRRWSRAPAWRTGKATS